MMRPKGKPRVIVSIVLAVLIAAILSVSLLLSDTEPETILPVSENTELSVVSEGTSVFISADERSDMLITKHPSRQLDIEKEGDSISIHTKGRGILEIALPSYLRLQDIDIETTNGDIAAERTMSDTLSLLSGSGSMLVSEVSSGKITAETESGNIIMTDTTSSETEISNSTGFIRAIGVLGENVNATAGSGAVYLVPIGTGRVSVTTESGDIDIIAGERSLYWNTETGKTDLFGEKAGNSGGTGNATVSITTCSGDIKISK